MKASTKTIVAAVFIGVLGFGGLAKIVHAKKPQFLVAIMPEYSRSIKVAEASDGDGETNDDAKEQQESARLQSLAKITSQQAQLVAERAIGGTSHVNLENENGNLVYAVKIGQQEVTVDAGNGTVLYTENGNKEDEKIEASQPKSSIQVPETIYRPSGVTNPRNTPAEVPSRELG